MWKRSFVECSGNGKTFLVNWESIVQHRPTSELISGEEDTHYDYDYRYNCDRCGQMVDARRFAEALYHEIEGHSPLPV